MRRGLWLGLVLGSGRAVVIFAMERLSHGSDAAYVRLRLANVLGPIMLQSVLIGLAFAGLLALFAALPNRLWRWLLGHAAVGLAALVFLAFFSGRLISDGSRRIGLETDRGQQALAVLAIGSLVLAHAFLLVSFLARERGPRASTLLDLALPLLLLAGLPVGWKLVFGQVDQRMTVRDVVLDLLAEKERWTIERAHPELAPYVGVLTPSTDYRIDGGDRPALILPPPARAEIVFRSADGPLFVSASAGVDKGVLEEHADELAGHAVRFRVQVDDDVRFDETIPLVSVGEFIGSEWKDVGGSDGLFLRDGDVLVLETALIDPNGMEVAAPPPLRAGFGGLAGETRWKTERTRSSPAAPNVILIVMDTQRSDRMSLYGYERDTTPHLAALGRRGAVFDNAYSTASWTWPSTASILTGMQPQEHGVLNSASCYLAETITTLPELLQRQGFTTAAWSANPLIVPDKNFDQGFELFDHGKGGTRKSEIIVPAVVEWLRSMSGTRFFLYLHLADPHAPLTPIPRMRARFAPDVPLDFDPKAIVDYAWPLLRGKGHTEDGRIDTDRHVPPEHQRWISELYDACVASGDHWIGQVLSAVEELGLEDETVIAFTSDHGEEIFDHGLATHAQSVYGELTNVPLILAGPGIPRGQRVSTPLSNRLLAPTLARLAGVELTGFEHSFDLARALDPSDEVPGDVLFSTMQGWWNGRYRQPIFGLRSGDLVLHWAPEGSDWGIREPAPGGQWRLYDLSRDPHETRDISGEEPERARAMRDTIEELVQRLEQARRAPRIEAGEETMDMLRGLGYVGDEDEDH